MYSFFITGLVLSWWDEWIDYADDVLDKYDMSEIGDRYLEHNWKDVFQGFFFRNKELIGEKQLILSKSITHELGLQQFSLIKFTNFNFQYGSINSTEVWIEVLHYKIKKVLLLTENDFKRLQSTDWYINYINRLVERCHEKEDLWMDCSEDYDWDEEERFEWPEIEMNSELEDYDEDGNYIFA